MGLLRSTYITNKIDTSGIEYQMKRKNDIQERQNIVLNNQRNRVDISLTEYECLKRELENSKNMLEVYQKFYNDLGKKIKVNPEALLKYKLVHNEVERSHLKNTYELRLIFEIEDKDLLEE